MEVHPPQPLAHTIRPSSWAGYPSPWAGSLSSAFAYWSQATCDVHALPRATVYSLIVVLLALLELGCVRNRSTLHSIWWEEFRGSCLRHEALQRGADVVAWMRNIDMVPISTPVPCIHGIDNLQVNLFFGLQRVDITYVCRFSKK